MRKVDRNPMRFYNNPNEAHLYTFSCFNRRPFLNSNRTRSYLVLAISEARARHGFHLWAYVFMPEHVHMLIWFPKDEYSMSDMAKSIKQSVSRRAVEYLKRNNPDGLAKLATGLSHPKYRFWQDQPGYDRNIKYAYPVRAMAEYIHRNPVRRGLVQYSDEWVWSSQRAWNGHDDVPLRIDKDTFPAC